MSRRKTGRNELCPCGSGKKYKKCCLYATEVVLSSVVKKENKLNGGKAALRLTLTAAALGVSVPFVEEKK